jgi:hypothetical protein
MILGMIGLPMPTLKLKRSERLNQRMGWANAAIVFAVAFLMAFTR